MAVSREVVEGLQYQGTDEKVYYTITTTPWGSTPTSVSVKAYDESNASTDVSSAVLSGSATVSGDIITLPALYTLTAGHTYRVECKFTSSGNILEPYFRVRAQ